MPVERPKDFGNTVRRLGRRLRPERIRIAFVIAMTSGSVAFTVFGPKILGNATDVLFNGVIGKRLPAGMSKQQAIALLRSRGEGQLADMIRGMSITPGSGSLSAISARCSASPRSCTSSEPCSTGLRAT